MGTSLSDIREDHIQRYLFALSRIPAGSRVLDCACGVGYGTNILTMNGCSVVGVDISHDAIDYARTNWGNSKTEFIQADAQALPDLGHFDWLVSLETMEHLQVPEAMLARVDADNIIGSVPNEDVLPYSAEGFPYHVRHYTAGEVEGLIAPFELVWLGGQANRTGAVLEIPSSIALYLVFAGVRT